VSVGERCVREASAREVANASSGGGFARGVGLVTARRARERVVTRARALEAETRTSERDESEAKAKETRMTTTTTTTTTTGTTTMTTMTNGVSAIDDVGDFYDDGGLWERSLDGASAGDESQSPTERRRKRDIFAESFASFALKGKVERDDGEKKSTPIKVSDKDKVLREWGDSLSWDANRLDGTTLAGEEAPSADVFDGILSQAPVDLDEIETAEKAKEAKREASRLAKERAKAEKEKKRLAREKAKAFAREAKGKRDRWDMTMDFDDIDDSPEEVVVEFELKKTVVETVREILNSDAARWAWKFFVIPSVIAQVVTFSIIDPIIAEQLKAASVDHKAIELNEEQEFAILERTHKFEQRLEFETLMGRQAPLTEIEKAEKIRHEADRLEAEEILHTVRVDGNRYGDLVFFGAVLIMLVTYADDAKIAVNGTKQAFFSLAPAQQAFILLLSSDVLVGYHSADGWQTVLRQLGGRYGIREQEDAISIFVSLVPVCVDVLFKFWVFKYLRRIAPSTQVILEDIERH